MTDNDRFTRGRTRLVAGLGIVAVSLVIATAIAGVGFAGGSISAAQYQYGKVTICHHTHSKKHPTVTITISQHAWPAHQRHGDKLGACAPSSASTKGHGHGNGKSHGSNGSKPNTGSTTSTSSTTTAPTHGHSGDDHGSSNGHHK